MDEFYEPQGLSLDTAYYEKYFIKYNFSHFDTLTMKSLNIGPSIAKKLQSEQSILHNLGTDERNKSS